MPQLLSPCPPLVAITHAAPNPGALPADLHPTPRFSSHGPPQPCRTPAAGRSGRIPRPPASARRAHFGAADPRPLNRRPVFHGSHSRRSSRLGPPFGANRPDFVPSLSVVLYWPKSQYWEGFALRAQRDGTPTPPWRDPGTQVRRPATLEKREMVWARRCSYCSPSPCVRPLATTPVCRPTAAGGLLPKTWFVDPGPRMKPPTMDSRANSSPATPRLRGPAFIESRVFIRPPDGTTFAFYLEGSAPRPGRVTRTTQALQSWRTDTFSLTCFDQGQPWRKLGSPSRRDELNPRKMGRSPGRRPFASSPEND